MTNDDSYQRYCPRCGKWKLRSTFTVLQLQTCDLGNDDFSEGDIQCVCQNCNERFMRYWHKQPYKSAFASKEEVPHD